MPYDLLADAVVAVHFAFVIFVAVGGLLAWRWPTLLLAHVPCVAWGALLVTFGLSCPLTDIERGLRERAGAEFEGGFVSRYLEGVIYPEGFTPHLRALAALAIVVGWGGLALRAFRRRSDRVSGRSSEIQAIP